MDISDISAMLDKAENASSPSNADILAALERVVGRMHSLEATVNELLKRSESRSYCIFCPVADNHDGHNTSRCNRFPGAVAKTMQVAELCDPCLKPAHEGDVILASNLHTKETIVACSPRRVGDHTMCCCAPTEDKGAGSKDDGREDNGQRADTLKKKKTNAFYE
ncbi:unnamed protein product [Haemonchus placei]|uniref:Uncharacterized protein n=1 Tax=Haemonchus placei TaxID=6290 RepID=A0A0N4X5P4_HAEPC|nr:unnamed protein product [Haemonchus placei]